MLPEPTIQELVPSTDKSVGCIDASSQTMSITSDLQVPTVKNVVQAIFIFWGSGDGFEFRSGLNAQQFDERVSVDVWIDDFSVDAVQVGWDLTTVQEEGGFEEFMTESEVSLRCQ